MKALKFSETFKWTGVPFLEEPAFIIEKIGNAANELIITKVLLFVRLNIGKFEPRWSTSVDSQPPLQLKLVENFQPRCFAAISLGPNAMNAILF